MDKQGIQLLMQAAKTVGLNPANLQAKNPFSFDGKTAEALQMAVAALDPKTAAQWRSESGFSVSLEAAAAAAGLVEMTQSAHESLMANEPDYVAGIEEAKARREAELLASWTAAADKAQEARGVKEVPQGRWGQWTANQQRLSEAGL